MSFKAFPVNPDAVESEGRESVITSLKVGKTTLRIMPPYSERGCWFREIHEFYFNLGGQHNYFPSPRSFGEVDPIWDYVRSVYESGNESEIEKVKEWRPSKRYLINAFILSEPNPLNRIAISVVKLPKKVLEDIKKIDLDYSLGYGDVTNIEKGFNFTISREGKGKSTTYSVSPHRENSNIRDILKERSLDLDSMNLHDLDSVYPPKTKEEMESILEVLRSGNTVEPVENQNIKVEGKTDVPEVEIKVEKEEK